MKSNKSAVVQRHTKIKNMRIAKVGVRVGPLVVALKTLHLEVHLRDVKVIEPVAFINSLIKQYGLQLRKPHYRDFHLFYFVTTYIFAPFSQPYLFSGDSYQKSKHGLLII